MTKVFNGWLAQLPKGKLKARFLSASQVNVPGAPSVNVFITPSVPFVKVQGTNGDAALLKLKPNLVRVDKDGDLMGDSGEGVELVAQNLGIPGLESLTYSVRVVMDSVVMLNTTLTVVAGQEIDLMSLVAGDTVSVNTGEPVQDASDWETNFGEPVIHWQGWDWVSRDTEWKPGGPNGTEEWARVNSKVTPEGYMEMSLTNTTGNYPMGAQLISTKQMGYGAYEATFEGPFSTWGKHVVFGLFTYDWNPGSETPGFREIDAIEVSRWGHADLVGRFTHYPTDTEITGPDYAWDPAVTEVTIRLTWLPDRLDWLLINTKNSAILHRQTVTTDIPMPGKAQWHMNMWCTPRGDAGWEATPTATVLVKRFNHQPARYLAN